MSHQLQTGEQVRYIGTVEQLNDIGITDSRDQELIMDPHTTGIVHITYASQTCDIRVNFCYGDFWFISHTMLAAIKPGEDYDDRTKLINIGGY